MPRQKSQHVDDPRNVGRRLRDARLEAGLSQRALSFPGCTPAYISRIEAGERIPSLQLLREFGRRLGVSADYLATGAERQDDSDRLVEAEVALRLGDTELAERLYRDVLEQPMTRVAERWARAGLGRLAFARGDVREAIEQLEAARCHELFDRACDAETLARAYTAVGEPERAIALLERRLVDAEARRDAVARLRLSVVLAEVLVETGSHERARETLATAIEESGGIARMTARARAYWSQSRRNTDEENPVAASEYARKALELLEVHDDGERHADAHRLLASIELDRGDPATALALLRRGSRVLETQDGETVDVARFKLAEAQALSDLGRSDEAAELARESATLLDDADTADAAPVYETLAGVYERLGERDRARELYERAIDALERHGTSVSTDAYVRLADLLKAEGRKDEALELLERAVVAHSTSRR